MTWPIAQGQITANVTSSRAADEAEAAKTVRFYVLLGWHTGLGAAVDPVGVLGVDEQTDPAMMQVAWMPLTEDTAAIWPHRLTGLPDTPELISWPERIANWLTEDGAAQLREIAVAGPGTLDEGCEAILDLLLAQVIPPLAVGDP